MGILYSQEWMLLVESYLGHSLDGDQNEDGFSIQDAYLAFHRGVPAKDYAERVKRAKAERYVEVEGQ